MEQFDLRFACAPPSHPSSNLQVNSIATLPRVTFGFASLAMSSEPQIIKRVRSRASRIRDASPPANDVIDVDSPSTTPDTLAAKLKNKQKRSKPKSRLSFGTDDQVIAHSSRFRFVLICCAATLGGEESSDGEVFKVKKSNLSRKLTLGSALPTPG